MVAVAGARVTDTGALAVRVHRITLSWSDFAA